MNNQTILLSDSVQCKDSIMFLEEKMKAGPQRTEIEIYEDGVLTGVESNRVVVTGAALNALKLFGITSPIEFPNYNDELNLDNNNPIPPEGTDRLKDKIVCLFCCDDSGCGADPDDIYVANFVDRIDPEKIFPFRYVTTDLDPELRQYYFGRKTLTDGSGKIAYYFKKFSTEPQLHVKYADGTQVIGSNIYKVDTTLACEVYIETQLVINKDDFKDYFDQVLGWDNARVSSVSLVSAWYNDQMGDPQHYKWYQEITPYTKLNFSYRLLQSLTSGLRFIYRIYY